MDASVPVPRSSRQPRRAATPTTVAELAPRVEDVEQANIELKAALFGPDPYHPAGILGDLNRSMVSVQAAIDALPVTMTAAIKAERAERGARKLTAWQRAGIIFGILTGLTVAGGTVYEVLLGLSHAVLR